MRKTYQINLSDFLDSKGNIAPELKLPTKRLAKAIGNFVLYATHYDEPYRKPQCFMTIDKKRCTGRVEPYVLMEYEAIAWECPHCGNEGFIKGWIGTIWDLILPPEMVH